MHAFHKPFLILIMFWINGMAQTTNLKRADSLFLLGNYKQAINEYAKTDTENASLQIARAYSAIGSFGKSILQYEAITSKNNENKLAKYELAKLYFKTNQPQKSLHIFLNLIKTNSQNPEYFYYAGRAHFSMGSIDRGMAAYKAAVELDNSHIKSLFQLSKFYLVKAENDSVIKYTDIGLKEYDDDTSLLNLKAQAYFNKGQFGKAAPIFERLLALGEKKPHIYKKMGYSYFREWEMQKAKKAYHKLLETPNEEGNAYYGLGEIYLKENVLDSAEIYFKKSIETKRVYLDQEYADLGRVTRLQNNTKKSLDYYVLAWEEQKQNQFYYYQVCTLADEYFQDPKTKLQYYENLFKFHDTVIPFIAERAKKRIQELKEEIHFKK